MFLPIELFHHISTSSQTIILCIANQKCTCLQGYVVSPLTELMRKRHGYMKAIYAVTMNRQIQLEKKRSLSIDLLGHTFDTNNK